MNLGPLVFLVAFFAMATSWLGFVLAPQLQFGRQDQVEARDTGLLYPAKRPGMAGQGANVYRANGCNYCHTEQTRSSAGFPSDQEPTSRAGYASDKDRGWGGRKSLVQSIPQDYLYDNPVMLGSQRVGPDLANIGARQTNEVWLMLHLYDPQKTSPGSTMPPYRYLFEKVRFRPGVKPPEDALPVEEGKDYAIVPTDEARQLVAYLLSLHQDSLIYPQTPPWPKPSPRTGMPTNAPTEATVGSTNVSATNTPAK